MTNLEAYMAGLISEDHPQIQDALTKGLLQPRVSMQPAHERRKNFGPPVSTLKFQKDDPSNPVAKASLATGYQSITDPINAIINDDKESQDRVVNKVLDAMSNPMIGSIGGPRAIGFDAAKVKFSDLAEGKGGNPKFYFSDKGSKLVSRLPKPGEESHIGALMAHDLLYDNYPGVKDIKVRVNTKIDTPTLTQWGVEFPPNYRGDVKEVLLHESQHLIQEIEKWATGGSPDVVPRFVVNMWDKVKGTYIKNIDNQINSLREVLNKTSITKWGDIKRIKGKINQLKSTLKDMKNNPGKYMYEHLLGEEEARRTKAHLYMEDRDVLSNPFKGSDVADLQNLKRTFNDFVKEY